MKNKKQPRDLRVLSSQVPIKLLESSFIPLQEKAIYALLHSLCKEKDLRKRPRITISQYELGLRCGLTEATVSKWLQRLEGLKWISIKKKGNWRPSEYTLLRGQ